jgi:Uma2 family endonuclease
MASPSVSLAVEPRGRLFTAADLALMPTHLPSGDVDFELDQGRLIVMVPPGHLHGATQTRLGSALFMQGEQAGHGRAFTEVGVVLSRMPDTVVGPDVAFITTAKLPVRESPEGYLETIPDLVIEIRSRNDTTAELDGKVAVYLAAGVRSVWVADPIAKTVVTHQTGSPPRAYTESDTITLDDPIPGFRLVVADVFRN